MRFINKNDPLTVTTSRKTYEGFYQGQEKNSIVLSEGNKKYKIPFKSIQSLTPERDIPVNSIQEMMSYYKSLLNERSGVHDEYGYGLLPRGSMTLSIDANAYELYRALLKMPDPSMYTTPDNSFGYTDSLMTFHNPTEYERTKEFLKKFGYGFTEIGMTDDSTEEDHVANVTSPYPKNVHDD